MDFILNIDNTYYHNRINETGAIVRNRIATEALQEAKHTYTRVRQGITELINRQG